MNSPLFEITQKSRNILSPSIQRSLVVIGLIVLALIAMLVPAFAQENKNPSGFSLPRFVSVRSEPTNVRVGPGTQYDVAWVFVKSELPVEIIQEFDTWRKIRDLDGTEGWVHKSLLTGHRMAYIAPWNADAKVPLRARGQSEARVRAWLTSNYLVSVEGCDGQYCAVSAKNTGDDGRSTYTGYVEQSVLWGVYPNESFN